MGSVGTRTRPLPSSCPDQSSSGPSFPGPSSPDRGSGSSSSGCPPPTSGQMTVYGLVTGRDLRAHPLPRNRVLPGPVQPDGCHRRPPKRQLVENGLIEITVNRHRRGARG